MTSHQEETVPLTLSTGEKTTAVRTAASAEGNGWVFIYAPGAGSRINDAFGVYACRRLAALGFVCVRFQFPYVEARRRFPDKPPALELAWREVIDRFRGEGDRLVIGGRSMGGRMASHVVGQGVPVNGLALFAYPLHPPERPAQRRDGHLPSISAPTLFCSGTQDGFATPEELRAAASLVAGSTVHLLEGADHGFVPAKTSGRTKHDVWDEAVSAFVGWLAKL